MAGLGGVAGAACIGAKTGRSPTPPSLYITQAAISSEPKTSPGVPLGEILPPLPPQNRISVKLRLVGSTSLTAPDIRTEKSRHSLS